MSRQEYEKALGQKSKEYQANYGSSDDFSVGADWAYEWSQSNINKELDVIAKMHEYEFILRKKLQSTIFTLATKDFGNEENMRAYAKKALELIVKES